MKGHGERLLRFALLLGLRLNTRGVKSRALEFGEVLIYNSYRSVVLRSSLECFIKVGEICYDKKSC